MVTHRNREEVLLKASKDIEKALNGPEDYILIELNTEGVKKVTSVNYFKKRITTLEVAKYHLKNVVNTIRQYYIEEAEVQEEILYTLDYIAKESDLSEYELDLLDIYSETL